MPTPPVTDSFDPRRISRPHKSLLYYYGLVSLLTGPGFPFAIVPLFFKYETLRYRFDDAGVSMSWGILFRREIYLTYRRIQDIHLTRNILQRWLGLATVSVQTASGSSSPEMNIDGILEADALRDFLYKQMRGAHAVDQTTESQAAPETADPVLGLLREIRDGLRQMVAQREPRS
jgi:uncharacterized membrane protein YdbT with pleckstrin-like domain